METWPFDGGFDWAALPSDPLQLTGPTERLQGSQGPARFLQPVRGD